eukprot:562517-Rhodomonas_salina.1
MRLLLPRSDSERSHSACSSSFSRLAPPPPVGAAAVVPKLCVSVSYCVCVMSPAPHKQLFLASPSTLLSFRAPPPTRRRRQRGSAQLRRRGGRGRRRRGCERWRRRGPSASANR